MIHDCSQRGSGPLCSCTAIIEFAVAVVRFHFLISAPIHLPLSRRGLYIDKRRRERPRSVMDRRDADVSFVLASTASEFTEKHLLCVDLWVDWFENVKMSLMKFYVADRNRQIHIFWDRKVTFSQAPLGFISERNTFTLSPPTIDTSSKSNPPYLRSKKLKYGSSKFSTTFSWIKRFHSHPIFFAPPFKKKYRCVLTAHRIRRQTRTQNYRRSNS